MKDLTQNQILQLSKKSADNIDYLANLYKYVMGDFSKIEKIQGWPKVSITTASFICNNIPDQSKKNDFNMLWLNKGFSSDNELEDWKINDDNVIIYYY